MNTTSIIKLVAALAWGGVAVSSATPATAKASTLQTGSYASCSAASTFTTVECGATMYAYTQTIKFGSTACGAGGCGGFGGTALVESHYNEGRSIATLLGTCGGRNVYGLGSCAC
jgi:hypothetical protein